MLSLWKWVCVLHVQPLSLRQVYFKCLVAARGFWVPHCTAQIWMEGPQFSRPLACQDVILWTDTLTVALNTTQVHILRPCAGLLQ